MYVCMFVCLFVRLNEYAKPITDLLRETENLNLAPELLEPEAQSIQKVHVYVCVPYICAVEPLSKGHFGTGHVERLSLGGQND